MFSVSHLHHVAIICSNYSVSKRFYHDILGFEILRETYREERQSFKLDLKVSEFEQIELFSFPNPPKRPSRPEAQGLRHLAFAVTDLDACINHLKEHKMAVEEIRVDHLTGRRFTFFADPDGLPLELYEIE
ncbi:VOC family protein [Marinomonas sp. NPDC078689]|uniref:SMU1112c/YaeR family gloxylase I-like metalloprotein n=1 Tax=Marinomonas sp. NPDC078689 TaxID=3364147 RepID=UPI0037C9311A